jgi:hypothetical protein
VKVYGTIPTMFKTAINKNKEKMKGKYLNPAFPMFSFTIAKIFSYKISITDCHLPGTKFFILLLIKLFIKNKAIIKNKDELVNERSKLPKGCIGINLNISNCSKVLLIIFNLFYIFFWNLRVTEVVKFSTYPTYPI